MQRRGRPLPDPGRVAIRRAGLPPARRQRLSRGLDAARHPDPNSANLYYQRGRPIYTPAQLGFVSLVTLVLYGVFLHVQTVRHRDYFLSDLGGATENNIPTRAAPVVGERRAAAGRPHGCGAVGQGRGGLHRSNGGLGRARRSRRSASWWHCWCCCPRRWRRCERHGNELQKSLNLALGSSLATIGLTIPAVSLLAILLHQELELGIDLKDTVMLVLTFAVSLVTFGGGRTNMFPASYTSCCSLSSYS